MTLTLRASSSTDASETADTERAVRRALGLDNAVPAQKSRQQTNRAEQYSPEQQKRRFARAGDVPVVVVNGRTQADAAGSTVPTNRLRIAEQALNAERDARKRAERNLHEAQVIIHDLKTKIGHAAVERDEAIGVARTVRLDQTRLEAALLVERESRAMAESKLSEAISGRLATEQQLRDLKSALLRDVAKPEIKTAPVPIAVVAAPIKAKSVKKVTKKVAAAPKSKLIKWWIKPKTA